MLISTNKEGERRCFELLLQQLVQELRLMSTSPQTKVESLYGTKLERYSYEILRDLSCGTSFDGSIELVSGQSFPDIIAKKYYGVEVKTSKSGTWKSIGSSVAEGTRIKGIERIYLLFGKLTTPIDFRCRLYEECLSGVAVTHSPRYTIDMDLREGETFFDKLKIPYDDLRKLDDPLSKVIDYFRENLKPGETTWWLSSYNSKTTKPIVRLWSSLNLDEINSLKAKGFCLFPELLSSNQQKFHRMLLWLSTEEGVVIGNLRDQYTAGGKVLFTFDGKEFLLPQILGRLIKMIDLIVEQLQEFDTELLQEYWGVDKINNRFLDWCELIANNTLEISEFPLKRYLYSVMNIP